MAQPLQKKMHSDDDPQEGEGHNGQQRGTHGFTGKTTTGPEAG
jgi:hypothetical protein